MRPAESFLSQPIRSLQTMLRVIAEQDSALPSLIPDGIYGNNTVRSVSAFQRRSGLPITGITDQSTWDAVVAAYELALTELDRAEPIQTLLNPSQIIRQGEFHPNVYLAQSMLTVLSGIYRSIPEPAITGTLDLPTITALSAFQELSLLRVTGELDKHTWRHLALHYPLASNLLLRKINKM
jgi:peptidoglycan hydrolase-like protein with peptidoglycan-binding domain